MGTPLIDEAEKPDHTVTLSSFYISKYEITVAQFAHYIDEDETITMAELLGGNVWTGGKWLQKADADYQHPQFTQGQTNPVVLVSWTDAAYFCNYLSQKENLEKVYKADANGVMRADYTKNGYRLPSEAEWEFAARGGAVSQKGKFRYIGSNRPEETCWFDRNADGSTHPVGEKKPNQLGLYDIGGNAAEFTDDWYGPYTSESAIDPHGPTTGKDKVFRGGSFTSDIVTVMPEYRDYCSPSSSWNDLGFRVARSSEGGIARAKALAAQSAVSAGTTSTTAPAAFMEMKLVEASQGGSTNVNTFLIGAYEVTVEQFKAFVDDTGYTTSAEKDGGGYIRTTDKKWVQKTDASWKNPYMYSNPASPVADMSYYDACEFCNWLSKKEGLSLVYTKTDSAYTADPNADGYRLPTEAEWAWAAKGGNKSKGDSFAGSDRGEAVAWCAYYGADYAHSGGSLKPNELGIYDMNGNLWEWCADLFASDTPGKYKAALRGGSWMQTADNCRISSRTSDFLEGTDYTFGFRVARSAK